MTDLVVESCDPRDRADQITALFARNGQPQFAAVFERVYRRRAQGGLRSWVGLAGGQVVAHISVSPQPFGDGAVTLTGGILGDLMADPDYRDFWAPLRLLRGMVADLKREGQLGFLLTTATPVAESLFRAGGFKPFGRMRRYVLPLVSPYLAFTRLRSRARLLAAAPRELGDPELTALLPSLESGGCWRPRACAEFYATRIPREDYAGGTWLRIGGRDSTASGWALLSPHGTHHELGLADAFWTEGQVSVADLSLAAAHWGRAEGFRRLTVATFDGSGAARQLQRAGFIGRPVMGPVLFRQLAAAPPPPPEEWFLTQFVTSTW